MQIDSSFIAGLFCLAGPFLGVLGLAVIARLVTRRNSSAARPNAPSSESRSQETVRGQAYAPIPTLLSDAEQDFLRHYAVPRRKSC